MRLDEVTAEIRPRSDWESVDLGLAAGASVASVGAALVANMTSVGATVAGSGVDPSGFAAYFGSNFSIVLPQVTDASSYRS